MNDTIKKLPAPTTIPHGHGPIGGFHALLDEARAQDHANIALSRGHANLIAEHIRLLEEQLGALQDKLAQPPALTADQERRLNEQAAIVNLLGHIEDDSNEVVTLFQEDATRRWHVRVGQTRTEFGETLIEALRKHFLHFPGECPDCLVTEEEKAQPPALKDSEGLGSVVDKLRHVALITGKRDAKSISAEELLHQWPDVVNRLRDMEVADDVYQPLRKLLGYVEDGNDKVVTIGQDDHTRRWFANASGDAQYGDTLIGALRKHFIGDCPDCRVTDEEKALLANGDYRPEELWGVGGVKTCPKCAGKKDGTD